jgi:hypothetical protein
MRIEALATDFDGTLAEDGVVRPGVLSALRRFRRSRRKLVLATGRELDDLLHAFPHLGVFDEVVAENGALLFTPSPRPIERPLVKPPPPELTAALRARGVSPLSCGRIIVATRQPHEQAVLEVIRAQGLELEVIFNKGAVMVLPSGVDKGSGVAIALAGLGIDPEHVVAVGDAENDHALLSACGLGVAVANAVPALKKQADLVMLSPRGQGIVELVDQILTTDLAGAGRAVPVPLESASTLA